MTKHQDTQNRAGKAGKAKTTDASPHLVWETPQHNPNQSAKQKGQLGQNVRMKEKQERQKQH